MVGTCGGCFEHHARWQHEHQEVSVERETVGKYSVPIDPMDEMQCESCQ